MRRPPISILFPYTTLFRSFRPWSESSCSSLDEMSVDFSPDSVITKSGEKSTEDRKSTRLNSSHTVSSYDVICLKKKRIIECRIVLHWLRKYGDSVSYNNNL